LKIKSTNSSSDEPGQLIQKSIVTPKLVSDALANSQQANIYHLARRSRLQQLSEVEQQKLISAMADQSEPFGWSLTSSCKVFPVSRDGTIAGWRIRLLKLKRKGGGRKSKVKGQEKNSRQYESQILAENAMFKFWKGLESPKSKKQLDHWQLSLLSLSVCVELIVVEGRNQQRTNVRSTGKRRRKAIGMSSNALLHEQTGILCRNLNSRPSRGLLQYSRELAAQKVQGYIRLRELTRGVKAQIKTKGDQTYREITLAYLEKFISAPRHQEKWKQLLLGADDDEAWLRRTSEYDREHAIEKSRSLANALQVMYNKQKKSETGTWQQACKIASRITCKATHWKTIQLWYSELHHKFDTNSDTRTMLDLQFKRSQRGTAEWTAESPFKTNKSLMIQLKLWARADLEHLTVQKCADWVNDTLLSDWTPEQLKSQLNIKSFPVTPTIVRRWMRDAGFKYEAYRKCYYVDRHEDPDVVADRAEYIPKCFEVEK
jgi:hypothetical protein